MRKVINIVLLVIVLTGIGIVFWSIQPKPRVGPWRQPDGTEISLAGVTYGKNHTMRYGDRFVDYLYPILPDALRKKFGCKVISIPASGTNDVVVWLWDKGVTISPKTPWFAPMLFYLSTVDEHGMDSWYPVYPNASTTWQKTNALYGFDLGYFPRRSRTIGIRVSKLPGLPKGVVEFQISNRAATNYPVWLASELPATVKTNGIEVSLVAFETLPRKPNLPPMARLGFRIPKDMQMSNYLAVRGVSARSATGEFHESASASVPSVSFEQTAYADLPGPLWQEEPAWKITAEFWRTANFPAEELWTVKSIAVPEAGRTAEVHATTNIYASEIEVMAITGGKLRTNSSTEKVFREPAVLHVTSPIPSPDIHLRLVAVKDDHGRTVEFRSDGETPSTGGRGATVRQLDKDYALVVGEDARSLDVTLAYTKSVSVEFMAKPTAAKEAGKK